ncbi:hypothetical protein EJ05DRAFT_486010 [Pseudovirgaria hyperparasitica]|uniref:Uncharacterized protein n=1 Tax=Pseudovirgaria hyperparasitica TaxID=470096 RepID=A0A6A6W5V9_9PEZI|nr:uncharacterized protein EJ05DRAFT_486010 [Pseudovirgaria hyperparasitica]KAF2757935.1 hypothetical protein EJ05DRAFT_486010 [Pseudovirgaria hyperparasitica]
MHHSLQVFVTQVCPDLSEASFRLTGESYAGYYLPTLGARIVSQNNLYPKRPQVNLKSTLIGNGLVPVLDNAFGYWETLCTIPKGFDKPVFNETQCDIMAANLPRCMKVARACYDTPDWAICQAAYGGQASFMAHHRRSLMLYGVGLGWFKQAKVQIGNRKEKTTFTFAAVDSAGNMVPYDRPQEALRLVEKWRFECTLE